MKTYYFLSASKEFSLDGIRWSSVTQPFTERTDSYVIFDPENGENAVTIYPAVDAVKIDTTLNAPGTFTPLTLKQALNTVFPKANTSSGGTGGTDYNALDNKPTIPSTLDQISDTATRVAVSPAQKTAIGANTSAITTINAAKVTVATYAAMQTAIAALSNVTAPIEYTVTADESDEYRTTRYLYSGKRLFKMVANGALKSTPLYYFPLSADFKSLYGQGTSFTFTRNFAASISNSPNVWTDVAHQTARFQNLHFKTELTASSLFTTPSHRDLTQAGWIKTNATAAKTATGIDAVANSASVLTATAGMATATYATTAAIAARTFGAFIKRKTGTGIIEYTLDGGTTWVDITTKINNSTFTRITAPVTIQNPAVGFRIQTSGDEIYVDVVEVQSLPYITSPGLGQLARNAEIATLTGLNMDMRNNVYEITFRFKCLSDGRQMGFYMSGTGNFLSIFKSDMVDSLAVQLTQASGSKINFISPNFKPLVYANIEQQMRIIVGYNEVYFYIDNVFCGKKFLWSGTGTAVINSVTLSNGTWEVWDLRINQLSGKSVVTFEGDSITANLGGGAVGATPLALGVLDTELKHLHEAYTFRNIGVSLSRIATIQARQATDVTPYFYTDAAKNILVLRIGINDVLNDMSAAQMLTDLQTYINGVKTSNPNWKIVLCDLLPFSNSTTTARQGVWAAYNAGLPNLTGYDVFCKLSDIPEMQDPTSLTYYQDGLHPDVRSEVMYTLPRIKAAIAKL